MCINKIKTALNNMKLSKILFKRSNEEYKTPPTSGISAGEIAFNTNENSPFITIGGKGSSGETKTVNIYRDRFFLNVVSAETDSGDTYYDLDEESKKKVKKFGLTMTKDPIRNGVFLIYQNKVYSLNTIQLTSHKRIVFDNLSIIGNKVIYSTLENNGTDFESEWWFSYNEEELYPVTGGDVKLDGYTSELSEDEEKIITANMTLNEALQKLEKVTTENEMTVSAALNQINERLTRLENA